MFVQGDIKDGFNTNCCERILFALRQVKKIHLQANMRYVYKTAKTAISQVVCLARATVRYVTCKKPQTIFGVKFHTLGGV